MGKNFPAHCICWFCNREYIAQSNSAADRWASYQARMHHIARHFRTQGFRANQIRPDYFFLDYIYRHGLIRDEEYRHAINLHELEQVPGLHEAGWRPTSYNPSNWVVEINRPRHNRRQRSSRHSHLLGLDNESSASFPSQRGYGRPIISQGMHLQPGTHPEGIETTKPQLCVEPIGRQPGSPSQPFQSLDFDVRVPNLRSKSKKEGLDQITEDELSNRLMPLNLEAEQNSQRSGGTQPNQERSESTGNANADAEETSSHSTGSSSRESAEDSSSAGDSTCLEATRCMSPGEIASMRRDVLIDRLMIWLQNLLAQRFAEWTCGEAGQSSGHQHHSAPPSDTLNRTKSRGQRAGKRRKATEDKDDDHREDGNGDDTVQKKRRKGDADASLLLACPFFKHNRESCRGTKWAWCWHGWPTVHRVKYVTLSP